MKKLFVLFLFTCVTFSSIFAQIYLPPIVVPGGQYTRSPCDKTPDETFIVPVVGDPYSFCICSQGKAYFQNCPAGLAYNPVIMACDYKQNVMPLYPNFPWDEYP